MKIFLSHSRKDEALVNRINAGLGVMDLPPIIYEDLEESVNGPDYQRIKSLIQSSDVVFLFLTENVANSKWTTYWVNHEVSLASAFNKQLVEFQVEGEEPPLPIGYCTDVVVVPKNETSQLLQVQKIAKQFDKKSYWPIGAIGGAAIGSILGPVGTVLGGILGAALASDTGQTAVQTLFCKEDRLKYRYWGHIGSLFYCPHCLKHYIYNGDKDGNE